MQLRGTRVHKAICPRFYRALPALGVARNGASFQVRWCTCITRFIPGETLSPVPAAPATAGRGGVAHATPGLVAAGVLIPTAAPRRMTAVDTPTVGASELGLHLPLFQGQGTQNRRLRRDG